MELGALVKFLESLEAFACELLFNYLHVFQSFFEPFVLQGFASGETLLWLANELFDEVLGFFRDLLPLFAVEVELAFGDHLEDLLVVIAIEGRVPTQQNIQDAPR